MNFAKLIWRVQQSLNMVRRNMKGQSSIEKRLPYIFKTAQTNEFKMGPRFKTWHVEGKDKKLNLPNVVKLNQGGNSAPRIKSGALYAKATCSPDFHDGIGHRLGVILCGPKTRNPGRTTLCGTFQRAAITAPGIAASLSGQEGFDKRRPPLDTAALFQRIVLRQTVPRHSLCRLFVFLADSKNTLKCTSQRRPSS